VPSSFCEDDPEGALDSRDLRRGCRADRGRAAQGSPSHLEDLAYLDLTAGTQPRAALRELHSRVHAVRIDHYVSRQSVRIRARATRAYHGGPADPVPEVSDGSAELAEPRPPGLLLAWIGSSIWIVPEGEHVFGHKLLLAVFTGTPSVPLLISTDGEVQNRHLCRRSFASDVASDLPDNSQLHMLAVSDVKIASVWRE
jgi:hypothetical protein